MDKIIGASISLSALGVLLDGLSTGLCFALFPGRVAEVNPLGPAWGWAAEIVIVGGLTLLFLGLRRVSVWAVPELGESWVISLVYGAMIIAPGIQPFAASVNNFGVLRGLLYAV